MEFDEIPFSKADYEEKERRKKSLLKEKGLGKPSKFLEIKSSSDESQSDVIFEGRASKDISSNFKPSVLEEIRETSTFSDSNSFFDKDLKKDKTGDKNSINFSFFSRFFAKVAELKGKKKSELEINQTLNPLFGRSVLNLAKAFGLPQQTEQRLKFYKNPTYQPSGAPSGDFSAVVYSVFRDLLRKECVLTVGELNNLLDELAASEDGKKKEKVISQILQKSTAEDLKWISKIILKDLKIGLKSERVLVLYHPEAMDLYNLTSNLREVCNEFLDRQHSLQSVLRLFHPIKPMLAGKKRIDEIKALLLGKSFLIETKFDGERIQCHFNNNLMKFFTRNSNDYTYLYGKKLDKIVRECVKAESAILDGEIIVLDKETGENVPFGMNKTVALDEEESNNSFKLCYKVFDLLYVKGHQGEDCNLMSFKLSDRKKILSKLVQPRKGILEVVDGFETSNLEEINSQFTRATTENQEGIIIKQLDTTYSPNDRSTNWIKMKGDYIEGLTDTMDLLIIGGYFGEGSVRIGAGDWTDHLTHFLLAVSKKINKSDPKESVFLPFCKVGTGYTVVELQKLRNKLKPNWVRFDGKLKPSYWASWNPQANEKPDVFIDDPSNSLILEIKAAELIRTNTFVSEFTLRFPRVEKVRYDKNWDECMTTEELKTMMNDILYQKNLKKRKHNDNPEEGDADNPELKKGKKVFERNSKELAVIQNFVDTDVSKIQVISDLFIGCEFYVANTDDSIITKKALEEEIVRHGGTKVQNFLYSNTHVIASIFEVKLQEIVKKAPINILYPKWIIDSVKKGRRLEMAPKYLLFSLPWLRSRNHEMFDQYGDSFEEEIDAVELEDIVNDMKYDKNLLMVEEVKVLRDKIFTMFSFTSSLFRDNIFYFHGADDNYERKMTKIKIILHGGKIQEKLIGTINFIVDSNFNELQRDTIKKYLRNHQEVCSYIKLEEIRKKINEAEKQGNLFRNLIKFIE